MVSRGWMCVAALLTVGALIRGVDYTMRVADPSEELQAVLPPVVSGWILLGVAVLTVVALVRRSVRLLGVSALCGAVVYVLLTVSMGRELFAVGYSHYAWRLTINTAVIAGIWACLAATAAVRADYRKGCWWTGRR